MIILFAGVMKSMAQSSNDKAYLLHILHVSKDSSFNERILQLKDRFTNQAACVLYIKELPALLQSRGFIGASVDSVFYFSDHASIQLYSGQLYKWGNFKTDSIDNNALDAVGLVPSRYQNKPVNFAEIEFKKQQLLNYYANNGYPFAAVKLDSIQMHEDVLDAILKANTGPIYHIDSIRIKGKVKISNHFMQRYLGIMKGSVYHKDKLEKVSKRLTELPFLREQQPAELLMLGTGSILDLFLEPKRSSQINVLIGFLPENNLSNKLQLTGDVNFNLKNALGNGETILLNWQQLQLKSPRLNIGYQHPYLFHSAFGIDGAFSMFKKDSSFIQLNTQLGVQYVFSSKQSGKLFIQQQSNFLLASGVDTNLVKFTKKLPANADVSTVSIGVD
ncbi:MAG: POTRA domain-containing protein, partial [Ferruginibacter sp.]